MSSEDYNEFKEFWNTYSDRQKWGLVFVLLVIVDTWLTQIALTNSLGVEANPLIAPIVNRRQFGLLIMVKSMVVLTVALAAERYKEDRLTDKMIINYAVVISVLVVLWNIIMIFGSILYQGGPPTWAT